MKKQEENNWKENEQQLFPVEDVFSELPPPIPLDALPDPFSDPDPVKEDISPESEESEEEKKELSPKKGISKKRVLVIAACALLVVGVVVWVISQTGKKEKKDDTTTSGQTHRFVLEDGQVILVSEYDSDYYGEDPDLEVGYYPVLDSNSGFVQEFYEITSNQLEAIEQASMDAFTKYCWDKPEDVVISSKKPLGVCLISKGQNAPVSSLAMIYEIAIDEYDEIAGDPNSFIGSYSLYWCVEFQGVYADGSFYTDLYEVQNYSNCVFGEEGWDIPGFIDLPELFTYLTGQGNDIQVMGIEGEEIDKVLVDRPQFFSSLQSDRIGENVRTNITVDILTELSEYTDVQLDRIDEEDMLFMVKTNKQGGWNMVVAPYCVHILDASGQEHTYYRAYGVTNVYVGINPRKDVFWKDENNRVDLTDEISLTGFESEEALIAYLYELFPDVQIWRIDMSMSRHIKDVLTPPTQKS